jgi:Uma2 family endonuclease
MSVAPPPLEPAEDVSAATVRQFSVAEYQQLVATGIVTEDENVELLEGFIVKKMSKDPIHEATVAIIIELLTKRLPPGWHVRGQSASATADSQPEPDVLIARGAARDFIHRHPVAADIALVIEVANTSLRRDRGWKRRIYGRAGMVQYWVVDLRAMAIDVFTDPFQAGDDAGYRTVRTFGKGQAIDVPLDNAALTVRVDELLP